MGFNFNNQNISKKKFALKEMLNKLKVQMNLKHL